MYGAINMGRVSPNGFSLIARSKITSVEDGTKSLPYSQEVYIEDDGLIHFDHVPNSSYPIKIWALTRGRKSREIVDYEM